MKIAYLTLQSMYIAALKRFFESELALTTYEGFGFFQFNQSGGNSFERICSKLCTNIL
jgi:hypothetical protein